MGLTVSRKTAKNLAVRRKNERILTVSRYKILTVNRIKSHYPIVTLIFIYCISYSLYFFWTGGTKERKKTGLTRGLLEVDS